MVGGRRLYIDLNANGDLADPGEMFIGSEGGRTFDVTEIRGVDGDLHTEFQLRLAQDDQFYCSLRLADGKRRLVGGSTTAYPNPRFGVRAQEAPILHFDGPLAFAPYGRNFFLSRSKKISGNSTLRILIGSAGLGNGTFARRGFQSWLGRSDSHFAYVDFEFPNPTPGGEPIIRHERLRVRDTGSYGYCSSVWAPETSGPGDVNITFSMPEWKKDNVLPCSYKLIVIGEPQDVPTLAAAIQTENEVLRSKIARVLRHKSHGSADAGLKLLVEQLSSLDPHKRMGAIHGLSEWKTEQVFELLNGALDDSVIPVRVAAIHALRGHTEKESVLVPRLLKSLAAKDVELRRAAAFELRGFAPHSPDAVETLTKLFHDPDADVRANALGAIAAAGAKSSQSIPRIEPMLHDPEHIVRTAAAAAIAKINRSAIGPLIGKLKSNPENHEIVQVLAAKALEAMGARRYYNDRSKVTYMTFYQPPYVDSREINNDDLILLQHYASIDELSELSSLSLRATGITDEALAHIKNLTDLTTLDLSDVKLTADGLHHIENLKQLSHLALEGTSVDSDGLRSISGLTKLTRLTLSRTKIDDAGMKHLEKLTSLESLQLDDTIITSAGLDSIKHLTELTFLSLGGTQITDDGLLHLKQLEKLSDPRLFRTDITSNGLSHLSHLQKLQTLDLSETGIDDTAIESLAKLKEVRKLYLRKTKFTKEGIAKLRPLMPKLRSLNYY